MKKREGFKEYCEILKLECIEFKEGEEWDVDKWNDSYIDFKETIASWNEAYRLGKTFREQAIEFALEFYQDASFNTHSYQPFQKDNGWYVADITKPPFNVGVMVFIPEEDNHQTSGMYDHDSTWVLLDEYRVPTSKVTHWRHLFEIPKDIEP